VSTRPASLVLGLVLLVGCLIPASASALTVRVVDELGVPQARVAVWAVQSAEYGGGAGANVFTNGAGEVSAFALPGATIHASRADITPDSSLCAAPEGMGGRTVIVPSPAPAFVTITLPRLPFTPYEPGLSARERGVVGLINNLRREHGLTPVVISTVLDEATDGYSGRVLQPTNNLEVAHCSMSSAHVRDVDAGYPGLLLIGGENIAWAASATEAFTLWLNDPPHLHNMLDPHWDAIGIANQGSVWVTDFSDTDPAYVGRAGWTGDYGDASLADTTPPVSTSGDSGKTHRNQEHSQHNPRLSFRTLRVRGHRLQLQVSIAPGAVAEGQLRVLLHRGHQTRSLRLSNLEARSSLGAGRWLIEACFQHGSRAEYLTTSITRRVQVSKGVRPGVKH
jgi:hypothetical protein